MVTATKSSKSARTKIKKTPAPAAEPQIEEVDQEEGDADTVPVKAKKPIEIDDIAEPAVAVEEKIEEDPLIGSAEDDENADEVSLDGEELNPFGDRWEE